MASPETNPDVARYREIAGVAYYLSPRLGRLLRVVTREGAVYVGRWTQPRYDVLVLGGRPRGEAPVEIPVADVARLEWVRLRRGPALAVAAAATALGAFVGAALMWRGGDPLFQPTETVAGAVLGALVGAAVGAAVVYVAQPATWLSEWQVLVGEAAA